jgi:predicted DCC family thiol-disulfide oxidoreductase YuxK
MNIVLFDGICNLCSSTVSFLIKHDTKNLLHFAAQQNQSGKELMQAHGIKEDNNSVLFLKNDKVYSKSDAMIEIAKHLTGWPKMLKYSYIIPTFLRNGMYDMIAKNRYRIFGKKSICFIPTELTQKKFL